MKKIILGVLVGLGFLINFSFADNQRVSDGCEDGSCTPTPGTKTDTCTGIKLNTNVPFIGNCIRTASGAKDKVGTDGKTTAVTQDTAFPILIAALTKFIIGVIVLAAFGFIVVGGLRMTMEGASPGQYKAGRDMIMKAVIAIALIGMSGIILNAINPNFFKTQ